MCVAYLLHDCAGTLDELPLGEAVSGAELQSSSFLDQVDTAMSQLLHPCLDLEANLKVQTAKRYVASIFRKEQSCLINKYINRK